MANWWAVNRNWLQAGRAKGTSQEQRRGHEATRPHRACHAQLAGIGSAKFADYHWHLGGRGVVGRHAFAGHRTATTRIAPADEIRVVRYCGGYFPARLGKFRWGKREQWARPGRQPDPRRVD